MEEETKVEPLARPVAVVHGAKTHGDAGDQQRRVVAEAGASSGDLLLRSPPLAAVLSPDLWATHCFHCFRTSSGKTLSRCGRCRTAHYCSRDCQLKDWKPHHQVECRRLGELATLRLHSGQISDVVMLGRVMRSLALPNNGQDASADQAGKRIHVSSLVWYDEDVGGQETQLLATLAAKLGFVDVDTPLVELLQMLSRFQNNNFSICDDVLLEIGAGCFPLGAMINHSCEPNCAITFVAGTHELEVRAIRPIDPAEEIVQTYVDIALPRAQRQQRLKHKYHFLCSCSRCSEPLDDRNSCDAFLDCDIDGVPQERWTTQQLLELEQAISTSEDERIPALQQLLQEQRSRLHPQNISLLQTTSALFSAEMDRGNADGALKHGEAMLEFYRRVYPPCHPMTGLHLFTLGDLLKQSSDQVAPKAREYLKEARDILQVTHGKHHSLVELLNERLQ